MDNIDDFPDWVPSSVIEAAKEIFPLASLKQKSAIFRLSRDQRMKRVWQTLRQKKRDGSGKYKYSTAPNAPEIREGMQQWRMRSLFIAAAAGLYYDQRPAITRRELVKLRKPYLAMAESLEQAKISLRNLGVGRPSEIDAINGLIMECRLQADNLRHGWIVIDRKVLDPQLRGALQELAKEIREGFGSVPLRVTSIIASVALDTEVTIGMVRQVTQP